MSRGSYNNEALYLAGSTGISTKRTVGQKAIDDSQKL